MGQACLLSQRIDLAHMRPEPSLAQTGYLLTDRKQCYVGYQDGSQGEFWIDLSGSSGKFSVEWLDTTTDRTIPGKPISGAARRVFTTPFPGPAVLILKRTDVSAGTKTQGD